MEIIGEYMLEILFALISAAALGFCKSLLNQNKMLRKMQDESKTQEHREMILSEIEPLVEELTRIKAEITRVENEGKQALKDFKNEVNAEHEHMYEDLERVQSGNDKNFHLIIESYKFRFIQLCKTHLKDGFITATDFEQITEMYKLYHGLGGNGQAQEYYDKVLKLDMREK